MKKLVFVTLLALGGCVTQEEQASACASARQAVWLADIALPIACQRAGKICDAAGAALKSAHTTVDLLCTVPN